MNIKNLFEDNKSRFYNVTNYNKLIDSFCKRRGYESYEINPLDDILFKEYMGRKGCEKSLLALINAIFEDKGYHKIKKLEIIENGRDKVKQIEEKKTIRDIRAIADNNMSIHLEIQRNNEKGFDIRLLFYGCGEIRSSLKEGQYYHEIPEIIQIAIIDDILFKEVKNYHNIAHICLKDNLKIHLAPNYRIHLIELPKAIQNEELDINNPLHRFILFFNPHTSKETMKEIMKIDEAIKMANNNLVELLKSQEEEHNNLLDLMEDLDHNTRIYNAKEEGREEGREEGMIDVALKLFDENFPIMKISEFTGLSINKLQNLFFSGK